ncbi:MAG: class I SAM-dependent methyltransferase [Armatimonadetes bacterium]|nr:class I SAM-dependent methyltransferase [Armatimonadota bacterium]
MSRLLKWIFIAARMLRHGKMSELRYSFWKRYHGLDLESVGVERLGLSPERSEDYTNSPGPSLERVLRALALPPGRAALDFGSGKGGAVFTLAAFPFEEVAGVELSKELVRVAERNRTRLRLEKVRFYCMDATEFTDLDRYTLVYMFNPFTDLVFMPVLHNLIESLKRHPRDLTLIYKNPVYHENVVETGAFVLSRTFSPPGESPVSVYTHTREQRLPSAQGEVPNDSSQP